MTALLASSLFNWQRGPLGDWGKSSAAQRTREPIVCGCNATVKQQQATTSPAIEIFSCQFRRMALRRTRTENLALTMLARDEIAAIWTLHLAAAQAYLDGNKGMAATILEIADAAESEWLRRARPLPS